MDDAAIKARKEVFVSRFQALMGREGIGTYAPPPSKLYHYTTAEGLKGIIESDKIWATNYRYVNDLTEIFYSDEILREEILRKLPSATPLVHAVLDATLNTPDILIGAMGSD